MRRILGFFVWADAVPQNINHTARNAKTVLVMPRAFDFRPLSMNFAGWFLEIAS